MKMTLQLQKMKCKVIFLHQEDKRQFRKDRSPEEHEEMQNIVAAFQDFIDASNTFEIVFSAKLGFLWLE